MLRAKIIRQLFVERWHEVWFFPRNSTVKGWQGTAPIMFVGLNPSTGNFPSKADRFFYQYLAKHKFNSAHLTDVYKIRALNDGVASMLQKRRLQLLNREYLRQEIAIVRPRLIVAMGKTAHNLLSEWFPNEQLDLIRHYSWAVRYNQKKTFAEDMRRVSKSYVKLRSRARLQQ